MTRAHVTSIDTDANGRVTGVTYVTDGQEFIQPAKVVLLASYTYENSRLLLLSKSKAFPNGLSNNHGQVGRHYFSHAQGGGVTALFPFNINAWYGLPAQGVAVDNFADDNFDHGALDYIGGGNLWVMSDRRPISAASMGTFGRTPIWGIGMEERSSMRTPIAPTPSYLQKTTLPYEDNFLDLDPTVKDPLGFPVCRITADYQDNERAVTPLRAGQDDRSGTRPPARLRRRPIRSARWARRRTRTAARGWAATPRPTSSTSGASRTKCRTSACSARR